MQQTADCLMGHWVTFRCRCTLINDIALLNLPPSISTFCHIHWILVNVCCAIRELRPIWNQGMVSSQNGRRVKIWRNICLPNIFPILLLFKYGVFMTLRLCGMKLFMSILRKALMLRQTSEQNSWACSALLMAMSTSSWMICIQREMS